MQINIQQYESIEDMLAQWNTMMEEGMQPTKEEYLNSIGTDDGPMNKQVGGNHYADLPIQPMEYSMLNGLDPCQHTAIKYITRFRDKGGVEDLYKAIHVIEMLIAFEEEEE